MGRVFRNSTRIIRKGNNKMTLIEEINRQSEISSNLTDIVCDLTLFIARKGIVLPEEIEKKIKNVRDKMLEREGKDE